MSKSRWKPVRLVVCIVMTSLMSGACRGPHPEGAAPDDRWGRGCPIPWGDETGPADGNFVEIYSPHKSTPGEVSIDLYPQGSSVWLSIDNETKQLLAGIGGYKLTFRNTGSEHRAQLTEILSKGLVIKRENPHALPSIGSVTAEGYRNAGMTIYRASDNSFEFGLRINGASLPVKLERKG